MFTFLFFCYSCKPKKARSADELTIENASQNTDKAKQATDDTEGGYEVEPSTCIDWIGYYSQEIKELDSIISKKEIKVKSEGFDKYGSANKLEGRYVLTAKNMSIDKIGNIAKYLAYKLCLSDNKQFNGILMGCRSRKVQVAIARNEKNYSNEAWAVVFNVFPGNKKGELITMGYLK